MAQAGSECRPSAKGGSPNRSLRQAMVQDQKAGERNAVRHLALYGKARLAHAVKPALEYVGIPKWQDAPSPLQ